MTLGISGPSFGRSELMRAGSRRLASVGAVRRFRAPVAAACGALIRPARTTSPITRATPDPQSPAAATDAGQLAQPPEGALRPPPGRVLNDGDRPCATGPVPRTGPRSGPEEQRSRPIETTTSSGWRGPARPSRDPRSAPSAAWPVTKVTACATSRCVSGICVGRRPRPALADTPGMNPGPRTPAARSALDLFPRRGQIRRIAALEAHHAAAPPAPLRPGAARSPSWGTECSPLDLPTKTISAAGSAGLQDVFPNQPVGEDHIGLGDGAPPSLRQQQVGITGLRLTSINEPPRLSSA